MNYLHHIEIFAFDDQGVRQSICVRYDTREAIDLPLLTIQRYYCEGLIDSCATKDKAVRLVLDDFGVPRV